MAERPSYSRRRFLRDLLGFGALTADGLDSLAAQFVPVSGLEPFRFAFLTDLHLMEGGALRSGQGIAACLAAVEKLDPRPDFILVGGDLVHSSRELTLPGAARSLDLFLKIWNDNTSLPARWVFGNHDLAGTSNPDVFPDNNDYGKGLFRNRFQLPRLFYSFDCKGWHFVVLDDIALDAHRRYFGELADGELAFLKADLDAHRSQPTIVCTHIPVMSNLPLGMMLERAAHTMAPAAAPKNLVCANGRAVINDIPGHHIRAILAGHLHFYEALDLPGVRVINSGAVCGNYWQGPMHGCAEGFGVVDLGSNGSVKFGYRNYGWMA